MSVVPRETLHPWVKSRRLAASGRNGSIAATFLLAAGMGGKRTLAASALALRLQNGQLTDYRREMEVPGDPWLADLTPVLETALDAVVVMREDGTIAGWNAVAEGVFGWSEAEAIGSQLSDLIIPHRYREGHHRGLQTYLETGDGPLLNRRIEISGLRSSGG